MSGANITNPRAVGKTQFPVSWSESDVAHAITDVATNPSSALSQLTGSPGASLTKAGNPVRFKINGTFNGVNMDVIYELAGQGVISAYPTR